MTITKTIKTHAGRNWLCASCGAVALTLGLAGVAHAQVSTATLNGRITEDATGKAGATVVATQVETGFVVRATAGPNGAYVLSGLRPGNYRIIATAPDGHAAGETLKIQVGQTATLDLAVAVAAGAVSELVVTAAPRHAAETKTAEVATNVTTQQLEDLPQDSRNFLNFADLAPGIRLSNNPLRQTFAGGANGSPNGNSLAASQVNVFIDGVSLKSNVQQGGVIGQDASRGNPFAQEAIQEFRVDTQNFKAEYENAGTSIITAVTKSGTNEFHGDIFGFFQNQDLSATSFADKINHLPKDKTNQYDYGVTVGGPIIKDKLFFFFTYEANQQNKVGVVVAQGGPILDAQLPFPVSQFEGTFPSPFHEDQYFGKITWQPTENNTLDLSAHYETDHEIIGFGGQSAGVNVSYQQAQDNRNDELTLEAKDTWRGAHWLNEATVSFLDSTFNPSIVNPNLPGENFFNAIEIGGFSTEQRTTEHDITLRDDFTVPGVSWYGDHVFKVGAKVAFDKFHVENGQNTNPQFNFNVDPTLNEDFTQPFEALFGTGVPSIDATDTQVGVFAQDDWAITHKLTVNLGIRWDYESNANDNGFVTPAKGVAALQYLQTVLSTQPGNFFNANDYISTGNNRPAYLKEFQPRFGASYDIFGDQKTVLFAGAGRYYDRTLFRNAAEESLATQFINRTFEFSKDGLPRNGQPTIMWQPQYLSAAGLNGLIATNVAPDGELRVLNNNTLPPYTDQFDVGIRQRFGEWRTSITFSEQRGYNDIGYFPANRTVARNSSGFLDFIPVPGYANIVASSNAVRTRYTAIYLSIEKPYTEASHWGVQISYTNAHSKQNGNQGSFNFDFPNIAATPFFANDADIHNQLVANGTVGLPYGIRVSSIFTLSSGQPYSVLNALCSFGFLSPSCYLQIGDFKHAPGFAQLDLALTKSINTIWGQKLELNLQLFNVFNKTNLGCQDGFEGSPGSPNPNFTNSSCQIGPPRTLQLGARYKF